MKYFGLPFSFSNVWRNDSQKLEHQIKSLKIFKHPPGLASFSKIKNLHCSCNKLVLERFVVLIERFDFLYQYIPKANLHYKKS